MRILSMEIVNNVFKLLFIYEPILVHMVLYGLNISQEILESDKLVECDTAALQMLKLRVDPLDVFIELGERHEDQEGPSVIFRANGLAFIVALVLAKVVVPELLLDILADALILFLSDSFMASEDISSDLLDGGNEIFFIGFHISSVENLIRIFLILSKFSVSTMLGHTLREFFLSHLVTLVCMEVLMHHRNRELQDCNEKEELSKTDKTITISISQIKNLVNSGLEFLDVFLVTLNLTIVVWRQRSKKVAIRHH